MDTIRKPWGLPIPSREVLAPVANSPKVEGGANDRDTDKNNPYVSVCFMMLFLYMDVIV
jgi:hypothetical protein